MAPQQFEDGVLCDSQIRSLQSHFPTLITDETIQPAGIDISSIFEEVFEMDTFSLPFPHEKVGDIAMKFCNTRRAKWHNSLVFEPGKIYLAKLAHTVKDFPCYGRTNTKSTIGRLFIHTKLMVDNCNQYDVIPPGYSGPLWLQIRPKYFRISTQCMSPLTQLRFFKGDARLTRREIKMLLTANPQFFKKKNWQRMFPEDEMPLYGSSIGSLVLSVDFENEIAAFRTKKCDEVIRLNQKNLDYRKYFDIITSQECVNGLDLKQGHGYLFGTNELCSIPGNIAEEVVAIDERFGEVRSHFAGFIDPGFGMTNGTAVGNSITLEVVAYENGITLRNQQAVGMLCFEHMSKVPTKLYQGNYSVQKAGPKLPKQFMTP